MRSRAPRLQSGFENTAGPPVRRPFRVPSPPFDSPPPKLTAKQLNHLHPLITAISARIVQTSADDLDREILDALQQVFLPLGVDRGGLLNVDERSPIVRVSHVWYGEGVPRVSDEINLAELFPWYYQKIIIQGQTLAVFRCRELPPEAEIDMQSEECLGNKSDLVIPLFIGSRVHHLIVVNAQKTERYWSDGAIDQVRLHGEIFVSALQRRETDQALRKTTERLDLAAASASAGLWELDLTTGVFWTTEKARQLLALENDQPLSLPLILEKVHPDDRAAIQEVVEQAVRTSSRSSPFPSAKIGTSSLEPSSR